jgi:rare lipoprotein A
MNPIKITAIIVFSLILSACGSRPIKPDSSSGTRIESGQTSARGGGYYLDDGPGNITEAEIARIPDAIPRTETIRAANSRPYSALGQQYVPMKSFKPYRQRGIASWYGKRYHGNQTASGEPYDMYAMTAAHTTLPIPSYVRVTNPDNGRSVVVRVNDRGPFLNDRLIDLSYVAAQKLGIVQKGSSLVDVEWIDTRPETMARAASANSHTVSNKTTGIYVQVGAFKSQENADKLRENLQNRNLTAAGDGRSVSIQSWYNDSTYRVRLGPYMNRSEADQAASRINQSVGINAIVVFHQ